MIELPVIPANQVQRKPDWLRVKLPVGKEYRCTWISRRA